jgi:F-type H+-transporting ATPase subunit a
MTIRNIFEFTGGSIFDLVKNIVGDEDAKKYFPISDFYFFINTLLNNMIGLIPGFIPATSNMNTTLSFRFIFFFVL